MRSKVRMGRPPKPPGEKKDVLLKIMFTRAQFDEISKAATSSDLSVAAWVRSVALHRAWQR